MYKTKDIKDAIYNAMVKAVVTGLPKQTVKILWYKNGDFEVIRMWKNTTPEAVKEGRAIEIASYNEWFIGDYPPVTEEAFRQWITSHGYKVEEPWQEGEYYYEFLEDCLDTYIQEDLWDDVDMEAKRIEKVYGIPC